MLRTIRLYGELGKKFGRVHKMHVASVGEAIKALSANFKGFKQHVIDSDKRIAGYEVWDGKYNVDAKEEHFSKHGDAPIKIIPRIVGASAGARILTGAVMIAIGFALGPGGWAGVLAGGPNGIMIGLTSSQFLMLGASLIIGGVVTAMTKTSSGTTIDSQDNLQSYIFSGPVNTTKQGGPVYVGYGKMIVGSQVISASLTTADYTE